MLLHTLQSDDVMYSIPTALFQESDGRSQDDRDGVSGPRHQTNRGKIENYSMLNVHVAVLGGGGGGETNINSYYSFNLKFSTSTVLPCSHEDYNTIVETSATNQELLLNEETSR